MADPQTFRTSTSTLFDVPQRVPRRILICMQLLAEPQTHVPAPPPLPPPPPELAVQVPLTQLYPETQLHPTVRVFPHRSRSESVPQPLPVA
jgi:hypothetical protein